MFQIIQKKVWLRVLQLVYRKKEVYIQKVQFSETEQILNGTCQVPSKGSYGQRPILYVTAENFIRCCSQLAYLIMFFITCSATGCPTKISTDQFKTWMSAHRMYYHLITMKFNKSIPKNTSFTLTLRPKKIFIRKKFIGCHLDFSGAITGHMRVVAVNSPTPTRQAGHFSQFLYSSWVIAATLFIAYIAITNSWHELDKMYLINQ